MTATTEGGIQINKQTNKGRLRSGRAACLPLLLHTLTKYNAGNEQEDQQYPRPGSSLESHPLRLLPKHDL